MSANTTTLNHPDKVDQVAALMLLVFEQNPDTRMTRRDIESVLNLDGFSESTRQRAMNVLRADLGIRCEEGNWPGFEPTIYWKESP